MPGEFESDLQRFEVFSRQVLAPAAFQDAVPLEVGVFQCEQPISFAEAARQSYIAPGAEFSWGPVWSTAWFRIRGKVPSRLGGRTTVLRFSTGTEATLWRDGVPRQGLDVNHDCARLFESPRGGETFELFVEAACNRPFGILLFPWECPEEHRRWSEARPGRLEYCELAAFDETAWRLWQTFEFARQILRATSEDAAEARVLLHALEFTSRVAHPAAAPTKAKPALDMLTAALSGRTNGAATRCIAVGHAHIDTAWLWRTRETRRKCIRTFSTVLRLLEQHPKFHFICSQPQQYAWIETDAPAVFSEIAQRVHEGRWEPAGAMWIEPDCNLPCGESLVRQVLHGMRYWHDRFGSTGRQRMLYLPDTFGFCPALPQIMRLAGLDTFLTNKLSWNDTTDFPYLTFVWRGLDGSEVVAHQMPGGDYNSDNRPEMLLRGHRKALRLSRTTGSDASEDRLWLQPYGYGDGGGGPSELTLLRADLSRDCPGLPSVEHGSASQFCERLHRRRNQRRAAGDDLPIWSGELYLEFHRGTYTSQAWLKRANRELESALRVAEWLSCFGPRPAAPADVVADQCALDRAWKLLLLNQFHDILPGSSIAEVYDDARVELAEVRATAAQLIAKGLAAWHAELHPRASAATWWIANPQSRPAAGVIECGGGLSYVSGVPALGVAPLDAVTCATPPPVVVTDQSLSNGLIEVTIGNCGRITRLRCARSGREAGARREHGRRAPLNELVLYPDVPGHYDAWEIVRHDRQQGLPQDGPADHCRVVERHPLRAAIEIERRLGKSSRIVQRYVLEAGSPRVDVLTRVDWHESRTLLRTVFPVDVHAAWATCETAFGYVQRPTHANTPFEQARFEFPAQRWVDLSEPGFGVALLNNGKYGHSCRENELGLSLLRSPVFPDPKADQGAHEFIYSLMLHAGDWRAAGVDHHAEALNTPLRVWRAPTEPSDAARPSASPVGTPSLQPWAPFELTTEGAAGVEMVACKWAERGELTETQSAAVHGIRILRLVETRGGRGTIQLRWGWPVSNVIAVDLLERPISIPGLRHDASAGLTRLTIEPFEIRTLAVIT